MVLSEKGPVECAWNQKYARNPIYEARLRGRN